MIHPRLLCSNTKKNNEYILSIQLCIIFKNIYIINFSQNITKYTTDLQKVFQF